MELYINPDNLINFHIIVFCDQCNMLPSLVSAVTAVCIAAGNTVINCA